MVFLTLIVDDFGILFACVCVCHNHSYLLLVELILIMKLQNMFSGVLCSHLFRHMDADKAFCTASLKWSQKLQRPYCDRSYNVVSVLD